MMNSELRKRAISSGWICTVCLFTLMILLASPRSAHGQWTTNGNNINNSNTGNVGVGTSSPGSKLTVNTGTANVTGTRHHHSGRD